MNVCVRSAAFKRGAMGKVSTAARFHEQAGGTSVDPRVMDILQQAAAAYGLDVQFNSGVAARKAGTKNHAKGYAVDVQLIDNGKPLPNYQDGPAFAAYEKFAQTARVVQQQKYPELDKTFRWGGYFSKNGQPTGYGAVDLMHFDINPKMGGAMGLGSWDTGASKKLLAAYPGAATNGGLGGLEGGRRYAQIKQQVAGSGGLVPPGSIPQVASLTDTTRIPPTPQIRPTSLSIPSRVPLPPPRPSTAPTLPQKLFATGEKPTATDVADMYAGIGLAPRPTVPKVRVISVNPDGTEIVSKPPLPAGRVPPLPTTAKIRTEARADQRQPLPTIQPGMLGRVSPPTAYGTRDPLSIYYKPPPAAQISAPIAAPKPVSRDISGPTAAQQKVIDGGYYALHPDERPAIKPPALTVAQRNALAATSLPAAQPTYQPGMMGRGQPTPPPSAAAVGSGPHWSTLETLKDISAGKYAAAPVPRPRPMALPTVPVPRVSPPASMPLSGFNTVNPMSQIAPRVGAYFNTTPAGHLTQLLTGQPVQGGLLGGLLGMIGNRQQAPQVQGAPPQASQPPMMSDQLSGGNSSVFTTNTALPASMSSTPEQKRRWFGDGY